MSADEYLRNVLEELVEIQDLRVTEGDPVSREDELFSELNLLRVTLGEIYINRILSHLL